MENEIGKAYPEKMVLISQREYDDLISLKANLEEWKNKHESEPIAVSLFSYGCMGYGSYKFKLFNQTEYMETVTAAYNGLKVDNEKLKERIVKQAMEIIELSRPQNSPAKKWYQKLFS